MHVNLNNLRQLSYLFESGSVKKPIVFVGSAGSGKSTVGRRVAKKLKIQFYDSDKIIEEREGLTVVEIYNRNGHDYFSQREREVVQEILTTYGVVILSTGSNAFIDPILHKFIKNNAITVWLHAQLDILAERISRRNSRPGFTPDNTFVMLREIIDQHYPIYKTADIAVESHKQDIYRVVDNVISKLKKYIESSLIE